MLLAAALATAAVIALAALGTPGWRTEAPPMGGSEHQLDGLVQGLFRDHLLAFEMLGVLLTAAMVGALVVARPMNAAPDETRYSRPTREQVQESLAQSDVRTRMQEAEA